MNKIKFRLSQLIGTFFYVGRCPHAPGTAGSLVTVILTYFLPTHLLLFNVLISIILLIVGVMCAASIETTLQIKDPAWVVIDEVLGMYLTAFWLPKDWKLYFIAFLLFRFFDITKFYPIKRIESIKAPGWGLMLDDFMAAAYACMVILVLFKLKLF